MAPERKRPTRSQAYQHLLVEKAFSHEMMESFEDSDGLQKKLNPYFYSEEVLELEDQLKARLWEIINDNLTDRQLQIINLLKQGKTQSETAATLKINQCLSGDSILDLYDKAAVSISELYKNNEFDSSYLDSIKIRSVNEKIKQIFANQIVAVIKNEKKQLIRIETKTGKMLRASADHKCLTNIGWMRITDIINTMPKMMCNNDSGIYYDDIISCKEDGVEETYDIEVKGPWHNFSTNCLIASNSSITKSIHGNISYENGITKASYGGICRKVGKIAEKDPILAEIRQKISNIRNRY